MNEFHLYAMRRGISLFTHAHADLQEHGINQTNARARLAVQRLMNDDVRVITIRRAQLSLMIVITRYIVCTDTKLYTSYKPDRYVVM